MKLGRFEINNIYNEDSYKAIKELPDKCCTIIHIDPPYQIEGLHIGTGILKDRAKNLNFYVNQMMTTKLDTGINLDILDDFVRIMKKINIFIWCNKEQIYDYMTYFVQKKKCNFEIIVWGKSNVPPFTNGHYLKDKEYCLYFWEPGVKVHGNYDTMKTVYLGQTNIADKRLYKHPTIKDFGIVKNLLSNATQFERERESKDLCIDFFVGSGTSAAACKELGINYLGFEINEEYYKIAKDRLNGIEANGNMDLLRCDFDKAQEEYNLLKENKK